MLKYETVAVRFEHTLADCDTKRVNRAVLTVYGHSEFAVLAELARQHPEYVRITMLGVERISP